MVLAFSNAKEFLPDENNLSSNDQTKNHDKLNSDTITSDDFDEENEEDMERSNRLVIHGIVVDKLFPRIKFLDRNHDLEFSQETGTICHYIFNKCGLNCEDNQQGILWRSARKWIMSSIARLRCDRCSAIRNEFFSK